MSDVRCRVGCPVRWRVGSLAWRKRGRHVDSGEGPEDGRRVGRRRNGRTRTRNPKDPQSPSLSGFSEVFLDDTLGVQDNLTKDF